MLPEIIAVGKHLCTCAQGRPRHAVVLFPITAIERGMVLDRSLDRAARQCAAGDDAFGQPADVLPAERDAGPLAVGRAQVVAGVAPDGLAGEADAGEALGGGEDDAAVGVAPGVGLVLAQDGELTR